MIFEFRFDPAHEVSWGYWCCNCCNRRFYDKSRPLHKLDCEKGDGYTYYFGPKEVDKVLESPTGSTTLSYISKSILEEQFSELVERFKR